LFELTLVPILNQYKFDHFTKTTQKRRAKTNKGKTLKMNLTTGKSQ